MTYSEHILIWLIIVFVLTWLFKLYNKYKPRLTTVLLPHDIRKVYLEYWKPYYWYDTSGNKFLSKKPARIYLFTI